MDDIRTPRPPHKKQQIPALPATKTVGQEPAKKAYVIPFIRWLAPEIRHAPQRLFRVSKRVFVWLKTHITRYPRRSIVVMMAFVLIFIGLHYLHPSSPQDKSQTIVTPQLKQKNGTLTKGVPSYNTLLPSGKTIESLGGWTRVSPPDRNPVFAYPDTIDMTPIIVSQQPLPKELADQPDEQVQQLADGYSATHTITVEGATVYMGVSAKGPQSVIFSKKGLLFLIKASAKLSDEKWSSYISSLR
jgi:hypothetical protein